jgi:inner membrane protein
MTTIYTHAVVGLGLARVFTARRMPWPYWVLTAFLPIIPDFDSFSTATYGTALGHRGITHSLPFALWVGCFVASVTFRRLRVSFWWLAGLFFIIIASHGLLDALTRGGMPIPFFWPLPERYGNWGPIPVSDLSFELPDPGRSRALQSELIWVWLPMALLVVVVMTGRRLRRPRSPTDSTLLEKPR